MANVKLRTKIFEGVEAVKLDTTDGGTITYRNGGGDENTVLLEWDGQPFGVSIEVEGQPMYLVDTVDSDITEDITPYKFYDANGNEDKKISVTAYDGGVTMFISESEAGGMALWLEVGNEFFPVDREGFYVVNVEGMYFSKLEKLSGKELEIKVLKEKADDLISGDIKEIESEVDNIPGYRFYSNLLISAKLPNLRQVGDYGFYYNVLSEFDYPKLHYIGSYAFAKNVYEEIVLPESLTTLGGYAFRDCTKLKKVTFQSKPTIKNEPFANCTALATINVPWAEGAVSGAPWGATNATVNYNYKG